MKKMERRIEGLAVIDHGQQIRPLFFVQIDCIKSWKCRCALKGSGTQEAGGGSRANPLYGSRLELKIVSCAVRLG
jgi:hypothetical protein